MRSQNLELRFNFKTMSSMPEAELKPLWNQNCVTRIGSNTLNLLKETPLLTNVGNKNEEPRSGLRTPAPKSEKQHLRTLFRS
jgi:hypothetical protein